MKKSIINLFKYYWVDNTIKPKQEHKLKSEKCTTQKVLSFIQQSKKVVA